jgi:hypothetical protein
MVRVNAAFLTHNPVILSVTCMLIHLSRIWCSVLLRVMLHIHNINCLDVGKSSECCGRTVHTLKLNI